MDDLENAVARAFSRTVTLLSNAGPTIIEIDYRKSANSLALWDLFTFAEGYTWHRDLLKSKRELYDPIGYERLLEGASISASDYIIMRNTRERLINNAHKATRNYDAVIMPMPGTAPVGVTFMAERRDDRRILAIGLSVKEALRSQWQ